MTDTIESLRAERDAALAACAEMRAALEHWTHVYGAALCPPGPDTYGEGMRDAKDQVRALLARTDLGRGMVAVPRGVVERLVADLSAATPYAETDEGLARVTRDIATLASLLDGGKVGWVMGTGTCWRCGASEDGALSSYGDPRDAEIAYLGSELDRLRKEYAQMKAERDAAVAALHAQELAHEAQSG